MSGSARSALTFLSISVVAGKKTKNPQKNKKKREKKKKSVLCYTDTRRMFVCMCEHVTGTDREPKLWKVLKKKFFKVLPKLYFTI